MANPSEADLALFHAYPVGEGPDGLAFGASGPLYVAMAASNQISVLAPDGTEVTRISSALSNPIPYAQDLRKRVKAAVEEGRSQRAVAAMYKIGQATVERWMRGGGRLEALHRISLVVTSSPSLRSMPLR